MVGGELRALHPSIHLSTYPSVHPPTHPSVLQSVHPPTHPRRAARAVHPISQLGRQGCGRRLRFGRHPQGRCQLAACQERIALGPLLGCRHAHSSSPSSSPGFSASPSPSLSPSPSPSPSLSPSPSPSRSSSPSPSPSPSPILLRQEPTWNTSRARYVLPLSSSCSAAAWAKRPGSQQPTRPLITAHVPKAAPLRLRGALSPLGCRREVAPRRRSGACPESLIACLGPTRWWLAGEIRPHVGT